MQARMMVSLMVLAGLAANCAKYPKVPSKAAVAQAGSASIVGTWVSKCEPLDSFGVQTRLSYVNSISTFAADGGVTIKYKAYTDRGCTLAYTQADLEADAAAGEDRDYLEQMLKGSESRQTYVAGKPDDEGIGTLDLIAADGLKVYNIYQLDGYSLFTGDACFQSSIDQGYCSTLAGDSPDNRPKAISLERELRRQ